MTSGANAPRKPLPQAKGRDELAAESVAPPLLRGTGWSEMLVKGVDSVPQ